MVPGQLHAVIMALLGLGMGFLFCGRPFRGALSIYIALVLLLWWTTPESWGW